MKSRSVRAMRIGWAWNARVWLVCVGIGAVCLLVGSVPSHAQDADFDPESPAWNGLAMLVDIASELNLDVEYVASLDLGLLEPNDGLLIVAPRSPIPPAPLTEFMRAGGRIALADDFGEGDPLLQAFGIRRSEPIRTDTLRLRNNSELLVARPTADHPLSLGVTALVTNHPQVVGHDELEPLFALSPTATYDSAIVLAGAVGEGRLTTIADPSVLINNMLELRGNRRFAANLLAYLKQPEGRLYLAGPQAQLTGRFGEPGADRPLHDLRRALEDLAEAELPPSALRAAGAVLACLLLIFAASVLPRRSPYGGTLRGNPSVPGGLEGRIAWFTTHRDHLLGPLLAYRTELRAELTNRLDLALDTPTDRLVGALRSRGMDGPSARALERILGEIERRQYEFEHHPSASPLTEPEFRRIFRAGEAALAKVRALE